MISEMSVPKGAICSWIRKKYSKSLEYDICPNSISANRVIVIIETRGKHRKGEYEYVNTTNL